MKIKPKFMCDICGLLHDSHGQAAKCCIPNVLTVYQCPTCKATSDSESEALACCQDTLLDDDGKVFPNGQLSINEYIRAYITENNLIGEST